MAGRRYTAELIKARAQGMRIVCSMGPTGVQGQNVVYSPRSKSDPAPWRVAGDNRYRFTGRECHAIKYS